ncbi:MAG: energy-coupling factor transporter transmembrane protein EcfT [Nitrospirota bacterium]
MKDIQFFIISSVFAACFFFLYPDKAVRRGIVPVSIFLFITFMCGLCFTGGRVIVSFAGVDITYEGLNDAIVKTTRVFLMIIGAKILMLTTSVDDMIAGLNRMIPSSKSRGKTAGKSSVADFVEITGMTLRAFPAIVLRLKRDFMEKAADTRPTGLIDRARLSASLAIPMLGEIINSPEKIFGELTDNSNN